MLHHQDSTGSGIVGGDSYFGPPSTPAGITSKGGGGGGKDQTAGVNGGSGGGGGGSSGSNYAGGATVAVTTPSPWPGPSVQGYAGGDNGPQSSSIYIRWWWWCISSRYWRMVQLTLDLVVLDFKLLLLDQLQQLLV